MIAVVFQLLSLGWFATQISDLFYPASVSILQLLCMWTANSLQMLPFPEDCPGVTKEVMSSTLIPGPTCSQWLIGKKRWSPFLKADLTLWCNSHSSVSCGVKLNLDPQWSHFLVYLFPCPILFSLSFSWELLQEKSLCCNPCLKLCIKVPDLKRALMEVLRSVREKSFSAISWCLHCPEIPLSIFWCTWNYLITCRVSSTFPGK